MPFWEFKMSQIYSDKKKEKICVAVLTGVKHPGIYKIKDWRSLA